MNSISENDYLTTTLSPIHVQLNEDGVSLPVFSARVAAGFPSPAQDHQVDRLDLFSYLVKHPQATFFMRVSGRSMEGFGIFDQDVVVIDRALQAKSGDIVVAELDGDFTIKQMIVRLGQVRLQAGNPTYPTIVAKGEQQLSIWGVVTGCVKVFGRGRSRSTTRTAGH
jgi:DNA polymerase V